MEREGYRKELFDFDEKSRKSFPRLDKLLPKADFEGKISIALGLDRIIFISMGIILAMVVVFAVGVERGRSMEREEIEEIRVTAIAAQQALTPVTLAAYQTAQAPQPQPAAAPGVAHAKPATAARVTTAAVKVASAKPDIRNDIGDKPYTIVAGSFKGRETGQLAVNRLKKEGFDAYLTQNDPYFVVCVGGYSNRDAAQAVFLKIKRINKDAYIKLR